MRWLCTACDVLFSSVIKKPVCWNCESNEHVEPAFQLPKNFWW